MKNSHNKTTGSTVERTDERIKQTGEVFTPMSLVLEMVRDIPEDIMNNPNSTFLDNSCGSGNFLVGLKQVLTEEYGYHEYDVVNNMLYGVDIMEDNIRETCESLGVKFGHPHFVVADALTYDYTFDKGVIK